MKLDESRVQSAGNGDAMHESERGGSTTTAPRHRHRLWPWLVMLVLIGGGAYLLYGRLHSMSLAKSAGRGHGAAGRAVSVVAAPVRLGSMNIYYEALGTVTAFETVTIHSRVDGQLMSVFFNEGERVKKGQPLALIDPRPYQASLLQAQGQLQRDQALLKNAQVDLDRYKSIPQSVTPQQIDTQAALVSQYQGSIMADQAAVNNATLNVEYCHINAPLAGRIGLRLVDEGNMIHATDNVGLAVITELQPIAVYFSLPEDEIQQVFRQPNQGRGLEVDALDRTDLHKIATGTLLASDSQIDPASATLRFKAVFDNKDDALFPSQFVNAWLLVSTLKDAAVVPTDAVQRGPSGNAFVYVVKQDSTVELRDVRVGHPIGDERVRMVGQTEGDYTAIVSGLKPGELVVTDGVDKLEQGTKVQARKAKPQPRRATTRPAPLAIHHAGQFPPMTLPSNPGPGKRRAQSRGSSK